MGKFKDKKLLKKISQIPYTPKDFKKLEETDNILLVVDIDDAEILEEYKKFKEFLINKKLNFTEVKFSLLKPPKNPQEDIFYILKCKYWENNDIYKKISDVKYSASFLFSKRSNLEILYFFKTFKSEMIVSPEFEVNVADVSFIINGNFGLYVNAIKQYLTE